MSYTVLARKYRSRTFDEVVGQAAVTTTLRNAIAGKRVHHGYLFCGTRGVGKTSMARILAKSLNCLSFDEPTIAPCGTCDSCRGISEGEDMDVIEIDAASNTSVDNIRELRTNTVLRPARARYKIYIIDEVHMLSNSAFNALLKTLEEPPPHVKFVLATTDPQKVPATIQSRVQRFDFKPISADEIAAHLTALCAREQVSAEPAAIRRIARLANGSMRDGLSLLDQVLSLCGTQFTAQQLDEIVPPPHDELIADLIDRIADSDAAGALRALDRSLGGGQSPDLWCGLLIGQLRDLMIVRLCGADTDLADLPSAARERATAQAARFDVGALVFMIAVIEETRRSVRHSGAGRALLEAAIVRLTDAPKFSSIETLIARLEGAASVERAAPSAGAAPARPGAVPMTPPAAATPPPSPPPRSGGPTSVPADKKKVLPRVAARVSGIAPPAAAAVTGARTRKEDLEAAYAEPVVQQVLQAFDGKILGVVRKPSGLGPAAGAKE